LPGQRRIGEQEKVMKLEERVAAIVAANIEKKRTVSLDQKLVEDLGVDSLAMLMIVNALEDELNISIPDEDFRDIKTVSDIVTRLQRNFPQLTASL
jgi:acyl carrier protein